MDMKKSENKGVIIRDLSWLSFNQRVLQEANDPSVPHYDRLKFLGIFSNNLDEFFRVRVATLNRMKQLGKSDKLQLHENPAYILSKIQQNVVQQQKQFDEIYANIIEELEDKQIFIKNEKQLTTVQEEFISQLFNDKIRNHIVPLMVEYIPQFPFLKDKSIYLACVLGNSVNPLMQRYTLIEIPSNLPRFVVLPTDNDEKHIILLEDIIRWNLPNLFAPFGYNQFVGYIIKMTRDAEFDLDSDEHSDIVSLLQKGIKGRKKGKATRFIYDRQIDRALIEYLIKALGLTKKDNLIAGGRIHNFKDFMNFPSSVFSNLKKKDAPIIHKDLRQPVRIMEVLDRKDVMLHFPYQTFDSLIDLLREAAIDPTVQTIKITCYRLAKESKIANALINAVRNGKKVTAVLELRARFDEAANIGWKSKLEEEGVKVIMGIPNMKVHAKLCIIKKREMNTTKQYGFISTGNFNENSSQFYGDHCLMTSNRGLLADVNKVFNYLENPTKINLLKTVKQLPVAPLTMRSTFINLIDNEIKIAKSGKEGSLIIKLNSLVDKELINKLTDAAIAGVKVNLIVRGIFCLITENKAFKKPIKAISIVDEHLEHARVFVANNNGKPKVYISSADWMVRNLDHRIEVACPILDPKIKEEIIEILKIQLKGNVKARILDNKLKNKFVHRKDNETAFRAQIMTYNFIKENNKD